MRTFNHVGIVTTEQVEGAMFNEGLKVWLTDYSKSPNRIEFLKFEEGSCLPELVQKQGRSLSSKKKASPLKSWKSNNNINNILK